MSLMMVCFCLNKVFRTVVRTTLFYHPTMQKAFGGNCMSQASVFDWYKLFKEGRERVGDEPRPGGPSTSTDDQHV